jgi:WD40 repeat protein
MLRVFSCSTDFSVALYDAFANKVVFKTSLHEAITTISFHIGLNTVFCGSSAGHLATFDLSVSVSPHAFSEDNSNQKFDAQYGIRKIRAHQSAITSLLLLPDNASLITSSSDGSLKFWNIFTLQFLRELFPFGKSPISNCLVIPLCANQCIPFHLLLGAVSARKTIFCNYSSCFFPCITSQKICEFNIELSAVDFHTRSGKF